MRRPLAALLLAATATLATCSPATPPRHTPTPTPRRTATPAPLPSVAPLALGRCQSSAPRRARCGTLGVPLDYAHPDQGDIQIAVIVLPAMDALHRIGSVLVNPGGPGGSGVDFLANASSLFTALNQRFDVVSWDPRGLSGPDAMSCADTTTLDHLVGIDPISDDPAEHQQLVDGARTLAEGCARNSARLLPHVDSNDVARDMDLLRSAVGDDKLTYLGFSYGTDLGARYAALFPGHVRAMALDGDIDPSVSPLDQVLHQADALEATFGRFVAACRAAATCPLNPDPGGAVDTVLSRLDAHPATVEGRSYGRGAALVAVLAAMYDPRLWPGAQTMFSRALHGDYTQMQALTDAYTGRKATGFDHSMELGTAVDCVDAQPPPDFATLDRAAAAAQQRDPHFGDDAVYGLSPCLYWPVHGPPAAPLHVRGAPTIVLVGATQDPATPYDWSQSLQGQIAGSVLLTRDGAGHTSYPYSTCISDRVNTYLETLQAPADGTVCTS